MFDLTIARKKFRRTGFAVNERIKSVHRLLVESPRDLTALMSRRHGLKIDMDYLKTGHEKVIDVLLALD